MPVDFLRTELDSKLHERNSDYIYITPCGLKDIDSKLGWMERSQPTVNRSATLCKRIKNGRSHRDPSNKNGILPQVGRKVQCFSSRMIFAIVKAALLINTLENEITESLTIYVEAALKAAESSTINSSAVRRCRTALENLHASIRLCWVPGHCNIEGNVESDELAKMCSQSKVVGDMLKTLLLSFNRALELLSQR